MSKSVSLHPKIEFNAMSRGGDRARQGNQQVNKQVNNMEDRQ